MIKNLCFAPPFNRFIPRDDVTEVIGALKSGAIIVHTTFANSIGCLTIPTLARMICNYIFIMLTYYIAGKIL